MFNRRLHRLVWVYTCQNSTLLEIKYHGSYRIHHLFIGNKKILTWPLGYKTWVHSHTQNKAQWLAACLNVSASSQSLRFILSLRLYSSFITSRPILYLLVLSADKLCKHLVPRSDPTNFQSWSRFKLFDNSNCFLKFFFKTFILKKSADNINACKITQHAKS